MAYNITTTGFYTDTRQVLIRIQDYHSYKLHAELHQQAHEESILSTLLTER